MPYKAGSAPLLKIDSRLHFWYNMYIILQHMLGCQVLRFMNAKMMINITKTCLFKYTENFSTKNEKFQIKNFDIFFYFCSKHRLWILVRTA